MDIIVHTGSTRVQGRPSPAALTFESSEDETAFLLLQAEGSAEAHKTLEEECVTVVRHALLGSEGAPWHRLDGTLKELNGLFKGMLLGNVVTEIHAIVAIVDREGTLHVSHAGRGEAYLVRSAVAMQITEFSKGKPMPAFVHISSGAMEPGDLVVLSTQRLLRTFAPTQLASLRTHADVVQEIVDTLEAEHESAAIVAIRSPGQESPSANTRHDEPRRVSGAAERHARMHARGSHRRSQAGWRGYVPEWKQVSAVLASTGSWVLGAAKTAGRSSVALGKKAGARVGNRGRSAAQSASASSFMENVRVGIEQFVADLRHPERRRRAHLLLLAGAVAVFLVIWMLVSLTTSSQRSKSRAELTTLVEQINEEIQTADTRKLAGDPESANAILERAEERAKQVMENEAGLFRVEALDLLDRIRQKREELNNVVRVSPRMVVNVSSKSADVSAQGLIGLGDGEFMVYDRQDAYRVLLNRLDDAKRVTDDGLILRGAHFDRQKSQVFLTTDGSLLELNGNQITTMKTDDAEGWMTGNDIETYLRYVYILSPEKQQIYKYERLSNRYGPAAPYNVNGELTDAVDMSIDGSVYVLKEGGEVIKLLRGEAQPFVLRYVPSDALTGATKFFKVVDGNFYFLDAEHNSVVVVTDGGTTGEAQYVKQYILEGEQLGTLQDLYVDPDQSHLYVIDEKRVYAVDLTS